MKTMRAEAVLSKGLCIESRGWRSIAIGAMLVTAWVSTATAAALGADPQAPHPGSHALESQAPASPTLRLHFADGLLSLDAKQRPGKFGVRVKTA
jgi:hypothetical protein